MNMPVEQIVYLVSLRVGCGAASLEVVLVSLEPLSSALQLCLLQYYRTIVKIETVSMYCRYRYMLATFDGDGEAKLKTRRYYH